MPHDRELDYKDPAQFMREVNPDALRPGQRVVVRLRGGTDYVFTFLSKLDNGDLYGQSALNGNQVGVNAIDMVLTEHG